MLLRKAEPADAIAVARVHVRSWQAAYRTLIPDDYLDQLRPQDRANKYNFGSLDPLQPQTIVATEGGVITGFATTAPATNLICQTVESSVHCTLIPNSGGAALALRSCRRLVLDL